jgi:calcineurin-like phosphoesterase family protein
MGDLTMVPAARAHGYLATLNGIKYFIRGNHDRFLKQFEPYAQDFVWVNLLLALRQKRYCNPISYVLK